MTHSLQPLDVAINAVLKSVFRTAWATWMAETEPEWTAAGNRRRPSYQVMGEFCGRALNAVRRPDIIKRAFTCCGLVPLPKMDGIERFFDSLNWRLRNLIHPDPLNMSREILLGLTRVDINRPQSIDDYIDMLDFDQQIQVQKRQAKKNRRASKVDESLTQPNSQNSANSTLPRLSLSFGIDTILN